MYKPILLSRIATGAMLIAWTSIASAQDPAGTNVPTPAAPAATPPVIGSPSSTATPLQEPVVDATLRGSTLPNKPLLVTGLVVLGASYGASVVGAAISDRDSHDKLNYPVVGPWMALQDRDCTADPCSRKTLDTTLLIGSGVVQGIGALSVLMSLFIPEKTTQQWYLIGNDDVTVAPLVSGSGVGATAFGRF
jgi:hypothetical protein